MMPTKGLVAAALLIGAGWTAGPAASATRELTPVKDNTLIETTDGGLSNGSADAFYAGRTSQSSESRRRAVLAFDLSVLPTGVVIQGASLALVRSKGPSSETADLGLLRLHALVSDWGEGESAGNGGGGASSTLDDATWIHTFYDPQDPESAPRWARPGGDHALSGIAVSTWDDAEFRWDSTQLVDQVQAWLGAPESNFGWLLIGDETQSSTSVKIASREAEPANRPVLAIVYVPEPGTWLLQMVALVGVPAMKSAHRKTHERRVRY